MTYSRFSPEEPPCDCGFDPCRCALIEERDEHRESDEQPFALDDPMQLLLLEDA